MSNNNDGVGFNPVAFAYMMGAIFLVCYLISFLVGVESNSTSTYTPSTSTSSFEERYVTERLKQEGYNQSDSEKAATAIMKFHEAQQARKR